MSQQYIIPRDRDAWPTINGYVYQVDTTIIRWLELSTNSELILEAGEDIDQVTRSIAGGADIRTLEQIRHRGSSITLRSRSAIEALANATEHLESNSGVSLKFCYTTNASPASERRFPFLAPSKGIAVWESVRNGLDDATEIEEAITSLKTCLIRANRPTRLNANTWAAFKDFVVNIDQGGLLEFIRSFTWSTGASDATSISEDILRRLDEREPTRGALRAQEQYNRLFFCVFRLLTKSGVKRLSHQMLVNQLTMPTVPNADRQLFDQVSFVLAELAELKPRVTALETEFRQYGEDLRQVTDRIGGIEHTLSFGASVSSKETVPVMDVPPIVERGSARSETLATVDAALMTHAWVALCGLPGTGKTQLAIMAAGRARKPIWLRLRGDNPEVVVRKLDSVVSVIAGADRGVYVEPLYAKLASADGQGILIVLDDVPEIDAFSDLALRLGLLATICMRTDIRLITTSTYSVPSSVRQTLPDETLCVVTETALTDGESKEILLAYGAPDEILLPTTVQFLNNLVRGHPTLFVAIASYLRRTGWFLGGTTFDELLAGRYAVEVNDETVKRLVKTVQDADSVELLFRLNLAIGSISEPVLHALANVDRAIQHPHNRLTSLLGLWVQREADSLLSVSPLIRAVGNADLPTSTIKSCNRALGDHFTSHQDLSEVDVAYAATYYFRAEEYRRAGAILYVGLNGMYQQDIRTDPSGILILWWDVPLPDDMELRLRIDIRALQIAVGDRMSRRSPYLVRDLAALADQAGSKEALAVYGGVAITSRIVPAVDFSCGCRLFLRQVQLGPDFSKQQDSFELPSEIVTEHGIWSLIKDLDTSEKLSNWIKMIEEFSPVQLDRAFEGRFSELGCQQLVDHLVSVEHGRANGQKAWARLIKALGEFADRARALSRQLLWAAAVRGVITITSVYLEDLDSALEYAAKQVVGATESRARFLITECIGRQLYYERKRDLAIVWLSDAVECDSGVFCHDRAVILIYLSVLVSRDDAGSALKYVEEAVAVVQEYPDIVPAMEIVKIQGELTIAKWLAGDMLGAFHAWDHVVIFLIENRSEGPAWLSTWVTVAHITGYLLGIATTGTPPKTSSAGRVYTPVERGTVLSPNLALADKYDSSKDCLMLGLMANFAEAVGRDDSALVWSLRALEYVKESQRYVALVGADRNVIAHLVNSDRLEDAVEVGLECAAVAVAVRQDPIHLSDLLNGKSSAASLLGTKPNRKWIDIEHLAFKNALVPAFIRYCTVRLTDWNSASQHAAVIADICRRSATSAADPILWQDAAQHVDEVDKGLIAFDELFLESNRLAMHGDTSLRMITILASTFAADASAIGCLAAHMSLLPQLYYWFGNHPGMIRLVIVPFIQAFWTEAFRERRISFSTPMLVERALLEAVASPIDGRGQAILRAIRLGLPIRLTEEVDEWLVGGGMRTRRSD